MVFNGILNIGHMTCILRKIVSYNLFSGVGINLFKENHYQL